MTADHRPASYAEYLANVSSRDRRLLSDRLLEFIRADGDPEAIEAAHYLFGRFPELFESALRDALKASAGTGNDD
jgi:hypothetical protein